MKNMKVVGLAVSYSDPASLSILFNEHALMHVQTLKSLHALGLYQLNEQPRTKKKYQLAHLYRITIEEIPEPDVKKPRRKS